MADIKNILQPSEASLSDEQLMQYLQGRLTPQQVHEVEKEMADSDFMNDAMEGLQQFDSTRNIDAYVAQLNHQLQKQTALKKRRKEKRRLKKNDWITLAIIITILICLLGYVVVNKLRHEHAKTQQAKP
jgi:hypothetical protein